LTTTAANYTMSGASSGRRHGGLWFRAGVYTAISLPVDSPAQRPRSIRPNGLDARKQPVRLLQAARMMRASLSSRPAHIRSNGNFGILDIIGPLVSVPCYHYTSILRKPRLSSAAARNSSEFRAGCRYNRTGSREPGADRPRGRTGSREPGAGSREPGAGSREPGAGSREPGAGSREPGADRPRGRTGSREPGAGSREPGAGSREPIGQPGSREPIGRAMRGIPESLQDSQPLQSAQVAQLCPDSRRRHKPSEPQHRTRPRQPAQAP